MGTHELDVNRFHDPTVPTLSEALRRFESLDDETPSRKARARSAVTTFARLLRKPATAIPAQSTFLVRQFNRLRNGPTGLEPKSLANCKSELRYLVRTISGRRGRSDFAPLSSDWLALRRTISPEPVFWKLSRFMAFCSAIELRPNQVDDRVVERFRMALAASGEVDAPEQRVRAAIRAWNLMVQSNSAWPRVALSLAPQRRKRWTILPDEFSVSFREDVQQWLTRLSTVDPEAEDGPPRALRAETLRLRKHQIFKAASALVFSGCRIEAITSLATLVDLDAFKALLRHLRERGGGQPTEALYGLATALRSIAKYYVRLDKEELKRLDRICANYDVGETGFRSKSRARLQNYEDEKLLGAILHMPGSLLEEAADSNTPHRKARLIAQIAVALEIELFAPIRLLNLVRLNLQQNIQAISVGRETRWIIRFERHETKNRSLLAYELPARCVKVIERAFRICEPANGWLFPGDNGNHKTATTLGMQVKREVERRTAKPFNIHLMRALNATLQMKEHENGFEIARAILGDRDDHVVRERYTATAERHLIAKAQDAIQRVRMRTAPIAPTMAKPQGRADKGGSDVQDH